MLKISSISAGNNAVRLRLEGRVAGPWVAEVQRTCAELLEAGRSLQLDLAEVSFVDPDGVALLSDLKATGVALAECSPFVEAQLKRR
jgi:ABC-type transporter Mla MlaB component